MHCHFPERSLTVGMGAPFAFHLANPGINFRMYYNMDEKICFGPEYAYFKSGTKEVIDFDFVGHYIFETRLVGIYPLIGANYTVEKDLETSDGFGVVFGIGIHRNFGKLTVFSEYSRVELGVEDQFVTAGMMLNFR